jgi:hypothetical protein
MLEAELLRADSAGDVDLCFRPLKTLLQTQDAEDVADARVEMAVDALIRVFVFE